MLPFNSYLIIKGNRAYMVQTKNKECLDSCVKVNLAYVHQQGSNGFSWNQS
jgi:hypothetical protein